MHPLLIEHIRWNKRGAKPLVVHHWGLVVGRRLLMHEEPMIMVILRNPLRSNLLLVELLHLHMVMVVIHFLWSRVLLLLLEKIEIVS